MFALANNVDDESQRLDRGGDDSARKKRKRASNDTAAAFKNHRWNNDNDRGDTKKRTLEDTNDDDKRRLDTHNINTRILERRYPLTKTGYKYLNVGIDVKPPSRANIILGDRHGKEVSLSFDVWKELLERKRIMSYLQFDDGNKLETLI